MTKNTVPRALRSAIARKALRDAQAAYPILKTELTQKAAGLLTRGATPAEVERALGLVDQPTQAK